MYKKFGFYISVIIAFKILLLASFSSGYSEQLFRPFVGHFLNEGGDTWKHYYDLGLNLEAFPYHPLMLYILSTFAFPIKFFEIENLFLINFLFKIPLLLSDIVIFYVLLKLLKGKELSLTFFYFLNPIVIYSIFIHSQLDIIPTAFAVLSLYLLIKGKFKVSALFLGLGIATKAHLFLTIPVLFIYIYKGQSLKKSVIYVGVTMISLLFFDAPFLKSIGFWEMVLLNTKQSLLFDSFYVVGGFKIFLPIFSFLLLVGHFYNQRKINTELLILYLGMLFTVLIFFISPSPAWYVWLVPYMSILLAKYSNAKSVLSYIFLSVFYLVFFVLFHKTEYSNIIFLGETIHFEYVNNKLVNISFTLLEASLAIMLFVFYRYGVKNNQIYKKKTNTVIGIGGDSGVGKSSLLDNISNLLNSKLLKLEGDGEHKWERGDGNWKDFTHLDPKANHIHHQAKFILELKNNRDIKRSDYNHDSGKFTSLAKVKPKEFISLCGLHPFYLAALRKNIDLKIYLDTDESLRKHWKIIRDTKKRGYSKDQILKQINMRVEDTQRYIYPQKQFADLIIQFYPLKNFSVGDEKVDVNLGLKLIFDASIHIEEILEELECDFGWDYNEDLKTQYINLKSEPDLDYEEMANRFIDNIYEIVDSEYKWEIGYDGFVQLVVLILLSEIMKGD